MARYRRVHSDKVPLDNSPIKKLLEVAADIQSGLVGYFSGLEIVFDSFWNNLSNPSHTKINFELFHHIPNRFDGFGAQCS